MENIDFLNVFFVIHGEAGTGVLSHCKNPFCRDIMAKVKIISKTTVERKFFMKLDELLILKILEYSKTHFVNIDLEVTPGMFETDMDTLKYHIRTLAEEGYIDAGIHPTSFSLEFSNGYTNGPVAKMSDIHGDIYLGELTSEGRDYLQNLRSGKQNCALPEVASESRKAKNLTPEERLAADNSEETCCNILEVPSNIQESSVAEPGPKKGVLNQVVHFFTRTTVGQIILIICTILGFILTAYSCFK